MPRKQLALFALLLALKTSLGKPVVIRSGLGVHQESAGGAAQNGKLFETQGKMQLANYEADEGFNIGHEKGYSSAQDQGNFDTLHKDVQQHKDEANYQDGGFKNAEGVNTFDEGSKKGHKKGHHKSGFHNTYHKDESGSNSSYFDDELDQGDHYNRNNNEVHFAENALRNQQGGYLNDKQHIDSNNRRGYYDNGANLEKNQGHGAGYGQRHYKDGGNVYDDRGNANNYKAYEDKRGQYENVRVQHPPPLPPPYVAPVYQRPINDYNSRITVYEDPVYLGYQNRPYRDNYRDYDRYIESRPYYDNRRTNYDYYY